MLLLVLLLLLMWLLLVFSSAVVVGCRCYISFTPSYNRKFHFHMLLRLLFHTTKTVISVASTSNIHIIHRMLLYVTLRCTILRTIKFTILIFTQWLYKFVNVKKKKVKMPMHNTITILNFCMRAYEGFNNMINIRNS